MPASMSKRSSSGMRDIHRELDRRRKLAAVKKGGVDKKSSAAPQNRRPWPIRPAPGGVDSDMPPASILHAPAAGAAFNKSIPRSPRRELVKALTAPAVMPSSVPSGSVKRGTTVLVRTTVGTVPTGQCLLLWLSTVVVSAAEDGYLEVVYIGNFPRDDSFLAVRVARDDVKNMPAH